MVSFEDPEEQRTWRFDVTFLLSHWECIFGRGCQGVLTGRRLSWCRGAAPTAPISPVMTTSPGQGGGRALTPEQWQFADRARHGGSPGATLKASR